MNQSALIIADFSHILDNTIQSIESQSFDFEKLYQQVIKGESNAIFCIRTVHPKVLFEKIIQRVDFIKAAGGLVKNSDGNYLFINRLGKWDLPKGKVEEGEEMSETAKREVEEECGISIGSVGPMIKSTYHSYVMKGTLTIKRTNWYEMEVEDVPTLIPQAEEDITEARWLGREELSIVRENTYPLINELIKEI